MTRDGGLTQEDLIRATRTMRGQVTYTAEYLDDFPPALPPYPTVQCPGMPSTEYTGFNTLQLREPDPRAEDCDRR